MSHRHKIEYLVVAFDEEKRKVRLSLRQADILKDLAQDAALEQQGGCVPELQTVKQYAHRLFEKRITKD